jgi:hypothetical protein
MGMVPDLFRLASAFCKVAYWQSDMTGRENEDYYWKKQDALINRTEDLLRKARRSPVLKYLGEGVGRKTYAIGPDSVVKFAIGTFGVEQNMREVSVYTDPRTRPIVAKVLKAAPDYTWIVSERADAIGPATFRELTGISFDDLRQYLRLNRALRDYFYQADPKSGYNEDRREYAAGEMDRYHQHMNELEESVGPEVKPFLEAIAALDDLVRFTPVEVAREGQWGATKDGRAVLTDYGLGGAAV